MNQKHKITKKQSSKDPTSTLDRLDTLKEKISVENKKTNIKMPKKPFNVVNLSIIIILGLVISMVSYQMFIPKQTYNIDYDQTLTMPDNMPSRTDGRLMEKESINFAYEYAKSDTELLQFINCHCGCMDPPLNHASNKECYWTKAGERDDHGSNCFTCIHTTYTAKALYESGWPISDIGKYINKLYAK